MKLELSGTACKRKVLNHHLLAMTAVPHYTPKARARRNHHQEEKGQKQFLKAAEREIVIQIGEGYCGKKHRTKRKLEPRKVSEINNSPLGSRKVKDLEITKVACAIHAEVKGCWLFLPSDSCFYCPWKWIHTTSLPRWLARMRSDRYANLHRKSEGCGIQTRPLLFPQSKWTST